MNPPTRADALTVREALRRHNDQYSQPLNGGGTASGQYWRPLAGLPLALPNFKWRQVALPMHDLHHVLVGYACTPSGEFEMAAWEFAAGRFPHAGATAFCLPLIGLGALSFPRRSFNAFVRGRASHSLYTQDLTPAFLGLPIDELRHTVLPLTRPSPTWRDCMVYAVWVTAALGWLATPAALLAACGWIAWP